MSVLDLRAFGNRTAARFIVPGHSARDQLSNCWKCAHFFSSIPLKPNSMPPTVVGRQSVVVPHSFPTLLLSFSESREGARAEDPTNQNLVRTGEVRRLGVGDERNIPIRGGRNSASTQSVTLRRPYRPPLHRFFGSTISEASPRSLTDSSRRPVAVGRPGRTGGDHGARLDIKSLLRPMRSELLLDGGFETPQINPRKQARTFFFGETALASWRIIAGTVDVQTYWPAAQGTRTLDLDGVSAGGIEQSFPTVPGQVYKLQFDYGNNPDSPTRTASATVSVSGIGTLLARQIAHARSTPSSMKYKRFSGTFFANTSTTTLEFTSTTIGAYGIVLDAVSVTAVPGARDTTPPVIQITTAPVATVIQNPTFAGQVTDTGTGVALLEAQVDSGPFQPVAFNSLGQFTFTTDLATNGTADGPHVVRFQATDRVGNVSPVTTEQFTLVTRTALFAFQPIDLPGAGTSLPHGINNSGQNRGHLWRRCNSGIPLQRWGIHHDRLPRRECDSSERDQRHRPDGG